MKLILNIESLYKPRSGIGYYTHNLLQGLLAEMSLCDMSFFTGTAWVAKPSLEQLLTIPSHERKGEGSSWHARLRSAPFLYEIFCSFRAAAFQKGARSIKGAVYHEPNFILKPYDGPCVATIHDLSHIHFPDFHPKERVSYLNRHLDTTLTKAEQIITDSSFVKDELVQMMGVPEEKVTAIYPGCTTDFHPRSVSGTERELVKYGVTPGQYLLSVATLEPRKNLSGLLDAFMQLNQGVRRRYPLVLVGAQGWKSQQLLDRIQDLSQKGEVIPLGYVPSEDLPLLYAGSRAVAFVPFYEGFGFPALEALASGVPLVTSHLSSIPEVVGDAALLVDPRNIDGIVQALKVGLEDENHRSSCIQKGIKQAQKFTWEASVEKTLGIYKKAFNA